MRYLSDTTVQRLRRVAEWPDLADTKYRLVGELGRGGMATVYLAEDTVLRRPVALKVVATGSNDPSTAERMLREARIIAGLEHPGIVPVHDAGALPDGRVFYAMKRVAGKRLDLFASEATLPEKLRVFQRACEAVAFAHARGVLHRDLKPENVMVGPFGEVLVMDWGVAKLLESAEPPRPSGAAASTAASGTADGTIIGTLGYMAPEQAEGRLDHIGPRTDVWSLGAILAFLLAGSAARPLQAIAAKAMAPRPWDRYEGAAELAADVARFLDGERVLAYREGIGERVRRLFRRHRIWILLILTYLVARTAVYLVTRGVRP